MRWRLATLLTLALVGFFLTAAPKSVAGPDCRKTPQAGPCRPQPSPSPTPTASPSPSPTPTQTAAGALTPAVDRTCATDVTAGLNTFLASVPNGATVDLAGGCYRAEGTVLLDRKTGVTIRNGTIRATTDAPRLTNRAQLGVNLGSGITLRDLTLDGNNHAADCALSAGSCYDGDHEWDHNLRVTGTDGVLVDHVTFRHAWGDAVAMSPGGSSDAQGNGALMARNVTVQGSSIDTTGRMGFSCTGCHHFVAQDNTITNIGYHVVDIEVEAPAWTGDATLLRNTYSNVYLSFLSAITGTGSVIGPFEVRGNVQTGGPTTCQWPVAIGQPGMAYGNVVVADNVLHSYNSAVKVITPSTVTVTGNTTTTATGCGSPAGAVVQAPSGTVSGNAFVGSPTATDVTPGVIACGNSTGGLFDQPRPC